MNIDPYLEQVGEALSPRVEAVCIPKDQLTGNRETLLEANHQKGASAFWRGQEGYHVQLYATGYRHRTLAR